MRSPRICVGMLTAPPSGIVTFTVAGRVSGRTPRIVEAGNGARRERPCSQPMTVTVAADHSATIAVTCIVP